MLARPVGRLLAGVGLRQHLWASTASSAVWMAARRAPAVAGPRHVVVRRRASTAAPDDDPSLSPGQFYDLLHARGLEFYAGVPDSLLKEFCAYLQDHTSRDRHVICANEGAAIGLAAGYHVGSGQIPVVYMQNSGLGNAINPLVSLSDPSVYSLPVLLLIGWRGQPGIHDEVQHQVQGRITPDLLRDLNIPFDILSSDLHGARVAIDRAVETIRSRSGPYALLIRQRCFGKYHLQHDQDHDDCLLTREAAIGIILDQITEADAIVSTTGFTSRELYEYRHRHRQLSHHADFYMVGSMGHATALSLGLALAQPNRPIWCFDGDGAALMHLGSMATIAVQAPNRLKHIVFNNAAHESVGGQPTGGFQIGFATVAEALGYDLAMSATTPDDIARAVSRLRQHDSGPAFLEIRICKGTRPDLGRPDVTPDQIKRAFMRSLGADHANDES